jgi:hypothetical protein
MIEVKKFNFRQQHSGILRKNCYSNYDLQFIDGDILLTYVI